MSLVVVGCNHRATPLGLLERMTVAPDDLPKALHDLAAAEHLSESVLLSTCNRIEVYAYAERFHGGYADVRELLARHSGLPPETVADELYAHHDDDAVRHLFAVAAGLDSVVVGEHEVLGQVRDAWQAARTEGTVGAVLEPLFRRAVETGKRARTHTGISRGIASLSHAAVALAAERLGGLSGRRVLVLGAGEVAGVATQAYGFVIDVAALAGEWPPILESLMGDLGQGGPTPEEFLGALPPLPAELVIEADSSGFVRGLELSLDLGAILMAVFAGFGEMGETPDGADIGLPEFEYLLSIRFETLAVNDPSLTVALPDPSLVVDLP